MHNYRLFCQMISYYAHVAHTVTLTVRSLKCNMDIKVKLMTLSGSGKGRGIDYILI